MKLHFVLRNELPTIVGVEHMNEYVPSEKRIVTIKLTPEQEQQIKPSYCGENNDFHYFERLHEIIPEGYEDFKEGFE